MHALESSPGATTHRVEGGFSVPRKPANSAARWIPAGETVKVAGLEIGGFVYFGASPSDGTSVEISLIDPALQVSATGDFYRVGRALWASYKSLTAQERRGYLTWLAEGRNHPEADMRLVFLYFYGLERRLTIDVPEDPAAAAEVPALLNEIWRLHEVYGQREPAMATAVECLAHWVQHPGCQTLLYKDKDPVFRKVYGLRAYTQIAVGQAAAAGEPIYPSLARTWVLEAGGAYLRGDVRLHRNEFHGLFDDLYAGVHGAGLVLPRTGRPLSLLYIPRSPALLDHPRHACTIPNAIDASGFKAELNKIKVIFDAASAEIERYAKLAIRSPHLMGTLDYLQQLPTRLWPQRTKDAMRALIQRAAGGLEPIGAAELVLSIDPDAKYSKATAAIAESLLKGVGLSTYPSLVGDSRAVRGEAKVVLLPTQLLGGSGDDPEDLNVAQLGLAAAVHLLVAGKAGGDAMTAWLERSLGAWPVEAMRTSIRLRAALQVVLYDPPSLTVIKKEAQGLAIEHRELIAGHAVRAAVSAGEPDTAQVKLLGKLYTALGLDNKAVPAHVHAAAAGDQPRKVNEPLALDAARIAALQSDTERVASMLSTIFVDEDGDAETQMPLPAVTVEQPPELGAAEDRLLGLDEAHSTLARQMLAKPVWSKAEVVAAAQALSLMPEGAIERINDACFDAHDIPFAEGDDPVEINPEILEILQ